MTPACRSAPIRTSPAARIAALALLAALMALAMIDTSLPARADTDATGAAVPYTTDEEGGELVVSIGDDRCVRGVQTYVIVYDLVNLVRHFSDTDADECYWDVNGTA